MIELVNKLTEQGNLSEDEFVKLLASEDNDCLELLKKNARKVADSIYSNAVYIRGLIEFSNICRQNCYYCGIRRENKNVPRFRLTKEQILDCCAKGYNLGFRTFVLQGGEDPYFTDDIFVDIIRSIKKNHPDCAVTLSIGVRDYEGYRRFRQAGADRFLLRHETAVEEHFGYLHPKEQSFEQRKNALFNLRELGYTVGSGIMVGSPGQKYEYIARDLKFLKELNPHMIGIGPFIPHASSKFKDEPHGGLTLTLKLISILRLMFPTALIPSTTALSTIDEKGRLLGIEHGANVVMPNLSPDDAKKNYTLYDKKNYTGYEAADFVRSLDENLRSHGYRVEIGRGDPKR